MTEQLFNDIAAWQRETFPTGTPDSTLHHLLDEIRELRYALKFDWPNVSEELADCMFLIFGCADRMGMSYQNIQDAISAKFEKNKARKWGHPDKDGVVKHVEEGRLPLPEGFTYSEDTVNPNDEGDPLKHIGGLDTCLHMQSYIDSDGEERCNFCNEILYEGEGNYQPTIIATPGEGAVIVEAIDADELFSPEDAEDEEGRTANLKESLERSRSRAEYCREVRQRNESRKLVDPVPPGVSEENATGLTLPDNTTDMLMQALRNSQID